MIKYCFECQLDNMKFGSLAKKLKDELDEIGMGYIWQNPQEGNANTVK
jgi:hypothetical protein